MNSEQYLREKGRLLLISKLCIAFLSLLPCPSSLFGLDFHFRPKGFASIPMKEGNIARDGYERFSMGGGGELGFEIDIASVWPNPLGLGFTLGVEGGMMIAPTLADNESNFSFYSAGGVLGFYFFPLSRLFMRVDGAAGVYTAAYDEAITNPGLVWRGGGEIGFRFTPGFTLAINGGWRHFINGYDIKAGSLSYSGAYAGLTAQITIQSGSGVGQGVNATVDQYGELFPVFMQLYQTDPIGNVVIRNTESAEIRNVRLSFRAAGFTASEFPCGVVSIIPRGRSVHLPLYADFSPEILRFTDTGRIVGELVIRYSFLGQERETVRAVTIATHNRNKITEGDESVDGASVDGASVDAAVLAAFVSPTSPETLDFARFIAGLSRASNRIGHNQNMSYAIWLLEGLIASGIRLGDTYSSNEVQYPAETLAFSSGSSRDLAILFVAALEAVSIPSAFIQVGGEGISGTFGTEEGGGVPMVRGGERPGEMMSGNRSGDFLVAVNLRVGAEAAETLFNGTDRILIINDEVWLPLSMTAFNQGFMACWTQGAAVLERAFSEGGNVEFVIVQDAWASYPPAPLPELGRSIVRTDVEEATNQVNQAIQSYIWQEIHPLIDRQTGNNTAVGQNRFGILLVRAGRIAEGKAAYERAAGMGSIPAMNNRGNLAFIEQDFATAERWFTQAIQRDSENVSARRGLERVQGSR